MTKDAAIRELDALDRELVLLSHISSTLVWDQDATPPAAKSGRGEQLGYLDALIHNKATSGEMEEILSALGASADAPEGFDELPEHTRAVVRQRYRALLKEGKLSSDFVHNFSVLTARAHEVWTEARACDDFSLYEPVLRDLVVFIREKADRYGYEDDPYDPLLDSFEPGMKTGEVATLFGEMKKDLSQLLERMRGREPVEDSFLYQSYGKESLKEFNADVLKAMGFDSDRGIVGESTHPYTITLGSDDIRITTRYTEKSVLSPIYSIIHEGGHALYEMGMSSKGNRGTVVANAPSLSFHESQSRFWENIIGRSFAFWEHFYPKFSSLFPSQLSGVSLEQFYRAVNKVSPTAIRVDADEVTYSLHIILRFSLERKLLTGELEVRDLPQAWREGMKELLGIDITNDREGVLQDIHWSMGEFGYFPTYALGNLVGAQITNTLNSKIDIEDVVRTGDFEPIHTYLREHVYEKGALYDPKPLLHQLTGEDLKAHYFSDYLRQKYL
ncbi:MAG: carboxypeptidase M32 [Sphaerochaetaceae bacterium]|nr:carboxypeptidase M32 [Sphaerochaetaceae bacterium]